MFLFTIHYVICLFTCFKSSYNFKKMHSQRSSTSSRASIRQQELFNQLMLNTNNLQKNWKIDLANLLDEYLNEIEMSQICDEDVLNTNFSEVALVLQNSAFIFSQKVKFFEQTVMNMHKSLSYKIMLQRQEMEKRREAERAEKSENNSSEIQNNTVKEGECSEILKTLNKTPKKEKKKPEEQKIEEAPIQIDIPEIDIEVPSSEECDAVTLQNLLTPLFKKISRRIIDQNEDIDDDFYSKLPLFSNGLNSDLKYTCCQILANCLKIDQSLFKSLKDFFMTSQKTNNNEDNQWELKLLAAKMMLLTEIKNNVNISVKEAPAKILEYINEYLTIQVIETSANPISESSVFYTPKSLHSEDFVCDSTDICENLFSDTNTISAPLLKELRINITRLSSSEIDYYTLNSETELNKTFYLLDSNQKDSINSTEIKLNILKIPERILQKRSLFQLPSDCIIAEKKKRLAEKKEERKLKHCKLLQEESFPTLVCDLEDFETFQREMLERTNANVQDFMSLNKNSQLFEDLRIYENKDNSSMTISESDFDSFMTSLNEEMVYEDDQLINSTQADSGIGSTVLDSSSVCLSQTESNTTQIDSDISLCPNNSILDLSPGNSLLEKNCCSSPLLECSENIADPEVVSLFNTISDVTHSHEQREKRVQEWYELIKPRLEHSESRNFFDIHEYGSNILKHFPATGVKNTIEFKDAVKEENSAEVTRYFSAVLQMATDYKIEISQNSNENLPMDSILLTNLTAERNYNGNEINSIEISNNVFDRYHFPFNNAVWASENLNVFCYGPKKPPTGKKRPGQHMDYT